MVSFMLYSLCKYQEYLEPLREEAKAMTVLDSCGFKNEDTPLMDSFLKESARMNPLRAGKFVTPGLKKPYFTSVQSFSHSLIAKSPWTEK
jgi:hypothetical protein